MFLKKNNQRRHRSPIGIPRAVSYFYHGLHFWEAYFQALGFAVVFSTPTTAQTVRLASRLAETEHCLPVKLFHAHLLELKEKVEWIFVPRLLSTLDGHLSCPKLSALPDVASIDFPMDVLTLEIDVRRRPLRKSLERFARTLGADRATARSAASSALSAPGSAKQNPDVGNTPGERFLILGHPYLLNDDYLSGYVYHTLHRLGAVAEPMIFSDEMVPESFVKWDTLNKMYHRLRSLPPGEISGVIQISAFNCGCDSMLVDMFREAAREKNIPFMYLMFDEHTSWGGVDTRLEAFVDSIRWRKQ